MNVRSARVFVAVAEELSFSRAAERLSISAPHVSETIKKLEREVGQALFDRSPRSVALTGTAEALLPAARALLSAHGDLEERIGTLRQRDEMVFGLFYGLASPFVRRLSEQLAAADGPIVCEHRVFDWTDPTCGLRSGDTDLALLVGPTDIDSGLARIALGVQRRYALLPADADVEPAGDGTISLADVDRLGWIPVAVHDETWDRAWRLDDVRGGPPRLEGPVQTTIVGMIEEIRTGTGGTVTIEAFSDLFATDGFQMYPVRDVPPLPVDLAFRGSPTSDRFAPVIAAVKQLGRPASFR